MIGETGHLGHPNSGSARSAPYTAAVTNVTKAKTALAAEVWSLLAGYLFSHRDNTMQALQALGLTPGHMKALFELDPETPVAMGELAEQVVCDASSATWLVDRLEEKGLVERRPHPRDRRVKMVVLTPEGVKTKALLIERLLTPPDDLLVLDRADLESLRDALRKLPRQPPIWASLAGCAAAGDAATTTKSA